MYEDTAKTHHAHPAAFQILINIALLGKQSWYVRIGVHRPKIEGGNNVVAQIVADFNGKLKKPLCAAVVLRIAQELVKLILAQPAQNVKILVQLL